MKADLRVVLTGATGGIGAAIAKALAPRCAALLLVGAVGFGLREAAL